MKFFVKRDETWWQFHKRSVPCRRFLFSVHRQDYTCSSGGILLYVRSDIAHRRIRKFEWHFDGMESICMELN